VILGAGLAIIGPGLEAIVGPGFDTVVEGGGCEHRSLTEFGHPFGGGSTDGLPLARSVALAASIESRATVMRDLVIGNLLEW
jgi:hypothetical protein